MIALRPRFDVRVLQISALDVLDRDALLARLERVAALPPERRRRMAVQLRDPQLPVTELLSWGRQLRERTRALGATLLVNDRLDVALALDADGVHLGRHSLSVEQARKLIGPQRWITRSLHDLAELDDAELGEVDGWLISSVFPSPGKATALGVDGLSRLTAQVRVRAARRRCEPGVLMALGGVDLARAANCLAHGADAVATIRADLTSLLWAD